MTNESSSAPPISWFTSGTWDAADGYLLTYGGDNFAGSIWSSTIAYQQGQWTTVPSNGSGPGPLDGPSLAYDAATHSVVMYGGYSRYSPFTYTNATYTYSAGHWNTSHLDPTPPAPTAAAFTYDPDLQGAVLFDGYNNSDSTGATLLRDLWLYRNGTWESLPNANAPAARTWPSMAFDPTRHELVVYGGIDASFACFGDTWTYNGTWHQVIPEMGAPGEFYGTQLAYDPALGGVVLTGGATCATNAANDRSWLFNGTTWTALNTTGVPSDHLYGVLAWDPDDQLLIECGGNPNGSYTDVLSTPLNVSMVTTPHLAEPGVVLNFGATVSGGVPNRNVTWDWGDGTLSSNGLNATHSFATTGVFDVSVSVTDVVGGYASATVNVSVVSGVRPQISLDYPMLETGVNGTFQGSSLTGSAPLVFSWSFGDGSIATGGSVTHAYSATGNYTVTLTVRDGVGSTASTTETVPVVPHLAAVIANGPAREAGVASLYAALLAGGVAPYQATWAVDGQAVGVGSELYLTIPTSGAHGVSLGVEDADGAVVNTTVEIQVVPSVSVTVTGPSSAPVGSSPQWTATVDGGVGPFEITWSSSTGARSDGTNFSETLGSAGNFTVAVTVNDSANGSAFAQLNVTVLPAAGSSTSAWTPSTELAGLGLAIALLAAAGALIWHRRRTRTPPR